jgi:glyoxylase-like metal-dependent hydrolase (beta-lactamase superfamily II)
MQLNNIGKWKVFALDTGFFSLDGGAMMGSVPKVLWNKTNPSDSCNRIELAMRCLLIDDGENVVLIESGIGDNYSDKFKEMFNIRQSPNALSNTLNKYGYSINSITHTVLTHLHFDHAGGAVSFDESQSLVPAFPNAKYYISESNWDAGLNPSPRDSASYIKDNYIPLNELGVLKIIPENSNIIEGVDTYVVNGHTVGQQLIKVSDEDEAMVFCSDLIPLESHLKLPWIMGYDLNAALTLKEKKSFLDLASDNNWLLFFYHDPDTVAVKIKKSDKYYEIIEKYERR